MKPKKINGFSQKQLMVMTWWQIPRLRRKYHAVICDGAVRSGKTMCMGLSFILWALREQNGRNVAMCGKTISSLRRNMITELTGNLAGLGISCHEKISANYIDISYRENSIRCYLFGGKDESSAALIQGITLAGVLFDEVVLMPHSFVEQALARCSAEGATFWFGCNPEHPQHWFYKDWIVRKKERKALYLHFTMDDNPSLSSEVKARYKSIYSGSFYQRFVLGEWVAPQGLIYPMFSPEKHIGEIAEERCGRFAVSCDYGTVNPTSMGLWGENNGVWYRLREYYYNSRTEGAQKTDEEHYHELEKLLGDIEPEIVLVDPSAASFIQCIRSHGRYKVQSAQNSVLDGIRLVAEKLRQRKIMISTECADCIREFSLYRWDEGGSTDKPIKEHDHAMDDLRYFVMWQGGGNGGGFYAVGAARRTT